MFLKSRAMKIISCIVLCAVMVVSVSGCSLPTPSFAEYDVSGYVKALLDSSYLNENESFMAFTGANEQEAEENNATIIENAAIIFCNMYEIAPSDEQMEELVEIMRQAYLLARYDVKDETKTGTGYFVEVDVVPLVIFRKFADEIEQAREDARDPSKSFFDDEETNNDESGIEDEESPDSQEEEGTDAEPTPEPEMVRDPNDIFVEAVIDICKDGLQNPEFGDMVTLYLDILQDDEGNLSIDTKEVEAIDRTVVDLQ